MAVALARRYSRSGDARSLREELGLSVRETARAVSVDVSTVSRWERGLRVPRGEAAVRFGHLLGLWLQSREAGR